MKKKVIKKKMAVWGQEGGNATLKKHGKKYFRDLAKKRWSKEKLKNKNGK